MSWEISLSWIVCLFVFVVLPEITGTLVNLVKIAAEREIQVTQAKKPEKDVQEEKNAPVGF